MNLWYSALSCWAGVAFGVAVRPAHSPSFVWDAGIGFMPRDGGWTLYS